MSDEPLRRTLEIWPWLAEPPPFAVCRDLAQGTQSEARFRVPLEHRMLMPVYGIEHVRLDDLADESANGSESFEDLQSVLRETGGLGLYAPALWPIGATETEQDPRRSQAAFGAVLLWPPTEWDRVHSELGDWVADEDDPTFKGQPFGLDDVLVFASINFSPDCWFLVRNGPMAGRVFSWGHEPDDDAPRKPWADSFAEWGRRLNREASRILEGSMRYDSTASIDAAPAGTELYPLEFRWPS